MRSSSLRLTKIRIPGYQNNFWHKNFHTITVISYTNYKMASYIFSPMFEKWFGATDRGGIRIDCIL